MALVFDRDFEPRHGEAVVVAPGVRRVTAANESPFTFRGTNTFLIGSSDLTILDPGPADPKHLEAVMQAVEKARVAKILVSHSHHDHTAGAPLLKEPTGAPIFAASSRRSAQREAGAFRPDAEADTGFRPDRILRDGDIVEGQDYRLEVVATPGHASDHLAFALAGTNILFSGDHVMGWSTSVVAPPDGSMTDYMASLDRLLNRPEDLYLPAHGGPIRNAHDYVRELKAHRLEREAAILNALHGGTATVPELVTQVYVPLDPRLGAAAGLSTLAHLEALVARGIVNSDGPPALDRRYWLAPAAGSG